MTPTELFRRRYPHPGSAPGTITPREDAHPSRIHVIRYDEHSIDEHTPASAQDAAALLDPARITWIDVQGLADEGVLKSLGETLGLHALAVADIANVGQRPKIEDYEDVLFAVLRMARVQSGRVRWEQVSMVIGRRVVVTFQERPGDCLDPLRARLRSGRRKLLASGADYLGCMVIDAIVDGYFPVLEELGEDLESIEASVIQTPDQRILSRIYRAKRELMTLRRAVWPLRDALSQLIRDRHALLGEHVFPYLRDTADHAMQVVDVTETYRELAGSFVEVYLSSVNNRTNEIMRVLTIVATIFIPLTFIAGVYGMNFDPEVSPWNMPELNWYLGYPLSLLIMLAVALGLVAWFHRKGWVGGRADPAEEAGPERGGVDGSGGTG
jgi:magnesium transporter